MPAPTQSTASSAVITGAEQASRRRSDVSSGMGLRADEPVCSPAGPPSGISTAVTTSQVTLSLGSLVSGVTGHSQPLASVNIYSDPLQETSPSALDHTDLLGADDDSPAADDQNCTADNSHDMSDVTDTGASFEQNDTESAESCSGSWEIDTFDNTLSSILLQIFQDTGQQIAYTYCSCPNLTSSTLSRRTFVLMSHSLQTSLPSHSPLRQRTQPLAVFDPAGSLISGPARRHHPCLDISHVQPWPEQ